MIIKNNCSYSATLPIGFRFQFKDFLFPIQALESGSIWRAVEPASVTLENSFATPKLPWPDATWSQVFII